MPIVTENGQIVKSEYIDDLLDSFTVPGEIQATLPESSYISALRVANAITALAPVANDLDYRNKLKILHSLDHLTAEIPVNERDPVKLAVLNILETGKAADDFMAEIPAPSTGPKFKPLSMAELLDRPPKQWLIDQVIGVGDLAMVYGASGSGKTHVVIDLIASACTGVQFAKRFDVVRPLNVAYAAGEGVNGLSQRFNAVTDYYYTFAPEHDWINFTFFDTPPQLYAGEDAIYSERITDFVAEWKNRQDTGEAQPLDILIVDTLHTATAGADENSAKDMGIVLQLAKYATKELGCAVILVHHTGKNGESERGSSALRGAMDTMIHIRKISETSNKAVMKCAKSKDGEEWNDQTFDLVSHLDSVRIWWDEPGSGGDATSKQQEDVETIIALLRSNPGTRYTARSIAEGIGLSPSSTQVFKLIKKSMSEDDAIKSGLKFPDKDAHSTNPTMYWYSPSDSLTH